MIYKGCLLKLKIIQDVYCLTQVKSYYRLIDKILKEKYFNKDNLLKMNMRFAIQVLSGSILIILNNTQMIKYY